MRRWIPFLVAAALVASVAFAVNVTDVTVFQVLFRPWSRTTTQLAALTPSAWTGYVAFDSSKGTAVVSDGTEWRSMSPMVARIDYDFPALGSAPLATPCAESFPGTVTGALFKDGCSAANGIDGGMISEAVVTCTVTAANTVKAKMCVNFADGGSYNPADAGYFIRVTH